MWYSFLLMTGPLVFSFGIAWFIDPMKVERLLINVLPKISTNPGEAAMCGGIILAVLIFWPWKEDKNE